MFRLSWFTAFGSLTTSVNFNTETLSPIHKLITQCNVMYRVQCNAEKLTYIQINNIMQCNVSSPIQCNTGETLSPTVYTN